MRGRRRYRVPRRPRIPPPTAIAPIAQHRGGNPQLACEPAQRPTAAHQQGHRFSLELIRKMTTSLAHSTPLRSRRSLAKVSTNSGEPHTGHRETRVRLASGLTGPAKATPLIRQPSSAMPAEMVNAASKLPSDTASPPTKEPNEIPKKSALLFQASAALRRLGKSFARPAC